MPCFISPVPPRCPPSTTTFRGPRHLLLSRMGRKSWLPCSSGRAIASAQSGACTASVCQGHERDLIPRTPLDGCQKCERCFAMECVPLCGRERRHRRLKRRFGGHPSGGHIKHALTIMSPSVALMVCWNPFGPCVHLSGADTSRKKEEMTRRSCKLATHLSEGLHAPGQFVTQLAQSGQQRRHLHLSLRMQRTNVPVFKDPLFRETRHHIAAKAHFPRSEWPVEGGTWSWESTPRTERPQQKHTHAPLGHHATDKTSSWRTRAAFPGARTHAEWRRPPYRCHSRPRPRARRLSLRCASSPLRSVSCARRARMAPGPLPET